MSEEKQTVLLIHSGGMSSRQWRRLAEALAQTHLVLAPDLLGSGDNPRWPDEAPFDFAQDLDVLEAQLGDAQGPVHLVGHSYGGLLALMLGLRAPARVRSLAAFDPVAFGVLHGARDAQGLADLARAEENPAFTDRATGGGDAWMELFIDYWNAPGAWRALPQGTREAFLRVGRKVFYEVQSLMKDRTPAEAYANIAAPALFLTGDKSPLAAQRVVGLLAAALPHARAATVEGAGHMGPLTHTAQVNAAIAQHIEAASL